MSTEQKVKELEKKVRELERSRHSKLSILKLLALGILATVLFMELISKWHATYRSSLPIQVGDRMYTQLQCGDAKVFMYTIEKKTLLGAYSYYIVKDLITGSKYPILMCKPKVSSKPYLL